MALALVPGPVIGVFPTVWGGDAERVKEHPCHTSNPRDRPSSNSSPPIIGANRLLDWVGLTGDLTEYLTGDLTGDLTGNLTGDLIGVRTNSAGDRPGDSSGHLAGDLTGDLSGDWTGDWTGVGQQLSRLGPGSDRGASRSMGSGNVQRGGDGCGDVEGGGVGSGGVDRGGVGVG